MSQKIDKLLKRYLRSTNSLKQYLRIGKYIFSLEKDAKRNLKRANWIERTQIIKNLKQINYAKLEKGQQ